MEEHVALFSLSREESGWLRGAAILLVLLGHTGYIKWGGAGGVALFLILSGYGLCVSWLERGLKGFWGRRLRQVWLPYLLFGVFDCAVFRADSVLSFLCTLLGLDFSRHPDPTMWYISFVLFWYLAFYVLAFLAERLARLPRAAVLLPGLLAAAYACKIAYYQGAWSVDSGAINYLLLFPLGAALAFLGRVPAGKGLRMDFWAAVLGLSLFWLIRVYGSWFDWAYALSMAAIPLAISQLRPLPMPKAIGRPLAWCGRCSYPMYLTEGLLLGVRNSWFGFLHAQALIDLCFLAATALSAWLVWELIQRILNKPVKNQS